MKTTKICQGEYEITLATGEKVWVSLKDNGDWQWAAMDKEEGFVSVCDIWDTKKQCMEDIADYEKQGLTN